MKIDFFKRWIRQNNGLVRTPTRAAGTNQGEGWFVRTRTKARTPTRAADTNPRVGVVRVDTNQGEGQSCYARGENINPNSGVVRADTNQGERTPNRAADTNPRVGVVRVDTNQGAQNNGLVRTPTRAAGRNQGEGWFVRTRTKARFVRTRTKAPTPARAAKCFFVLFVALLAAGCNSSSSDSPDETPDVRTPVTVTTVSHLPLNEYIELNATSTYMQQNYVKSNLNGYIEKSNIKYGDYVHVGQPLFVLKTKEARAIGNAVNRLDSSFNFSGVNVLHSNASGYVMEVSHQPGDYVQDGEQLAVISDTRSFMFVMNVPYEDKPYVSIGKHVDILLPGNEVLPGVIASSLPVIDSVSQTQQYSIRVNARHSIPKDLIAKVKILKKSVQDAQTLPKQSVLSDQTQTNYWVMKLINDSTAVKVPVKTGIEQGDTVQVLSPQFDAGTKILSGGNYGLSDTAGVIIQTTKTTSADSTKANP